MKLYFLSPWLPFNSESVCPSTRYLGAATDVRAGMAIFYVLSNVTILAKCPLGNRHTNYQHMTEVGGNQQPGTFSLEPTHY